MHSEPGPEDWEQVDAWTRRIGRWSFVGVPVWLLLLAAFNQRLTGIPWIAGLTMATLIATVVVVIVDRRGLPRGSHGRLGPFGRVLVVWVAVFFPLALIIGSGSSGGVGFLVLPMLIATLAAGGVELARRVRGRR